MSVLPDPSNVENRGNGGVVSGGTLKKTPAAVSASINSQSDTYNGLRDVVCTVPVPQIWHLDRSAAGPGLSPMLQNLIVAMLKIIVATLQNCIVATNNIFVYVATCVIYVTVYNCWA